MKLELLLAIFAGMFFGLASILMKLALPTREFSVTFIQDWEKLIFSIPFFGFMFFSILATLFLWWCFKYEKITVSTPISTAVAIVVVVIGGLSIFNEEINLIKIFATLMIVFGVIVLKK
jgi:multidrug transporter EmrE-like cation transporter